MAAGQMSPLSLFIASARASATGKNGFFSFDIKPDFENIIN